MSIVEKLQASTASATDPGEVDSPDDEDEHEEPSTNAAGRRWGGKAGPRQDVDLEAITRHAEAIAALLKRPFQDINGLGLIFDLKSTATRSITERADFPASFKVGRYDAWRTSDILAWLDRQAAKAAAERPD